MQLTDIHVIVEHKAWIRFFDEMKAESDRGSAVLAAAWVDDLLARRLGQLARERHVRRRSTHSAKQPSTFSARIKAANAAGILDGDVYHDLQLLRRIRNHFAHHIHGTSLDAPEVRVLVDDLKLPRREYYDWDELSAAATAQGDGVVLYTGDRPPGAGEPLVIPVAFKFRWAVSVLLAYLSSDIGVGILLPESDPDGRGGRRVSEPEET